MLKWLRYLALLPQLVGFIRGILELVRDAEELLAGGHRGEEKKALVLDLVTAAVELGRGLGIREAEGIDAAKVREVVGLVIDQLVGILNALGIFKHAPAAEG